MLFKDFYKANFFDNRFEIFVKFSQKLSMTKSQFEKVGMSWVFL